LDVRPLAQATKNVDARRSWHRKIEEQDIGIQLMDEPDCFIAAVRFAYHAEIHLRPQNIPQAGAENRVIVGNHNPNL
jgi:hypothetical protein